MPVRNKENRRSAKKRVFRRSERPAGCLFFAAKVEIEGAILLRQIFFFGSYGRIIVTYKRKGCYERNIFL